MIGETNLAPKQFFWDLETTSRKVKTAGIREIAIIDADDPTQVFHAHILPSAPFRHRYMKAKYYDTAYPNVPRKLKKVWPEMMQWMQRRSKPGQQIFLTSHNCYKWDWKVLKEQSDWLQMKYADKRDISQLFDQVDKAEKYDKKRARYIIPDHIHPLCTAYLAGGMQGKNIGKTLTGLCEKYKVNQYPAHSAMNDAVMTMGLFNTFLGRASRGDVLTAALNKEGGPIRNAVRVIKDQNTALELEKPLKRWKAGTDKIGATAWKANQVMIVMFDFETTGLDEQVDRVIQVGGYIPRTGATFNELVNPEGVKSHPKAFDAHGIKDEDLVDKDKFVTVWNRFEQFIVNNLAKPEETLVVLAGHNVIPFDIKFYREEMKRANAASRFWPLFDTLLLNRNLFMQKHTGGAKLPRKGFHKLQSLKDRLELLRGHEAELKAGVFKAHDALGDVRLNWLFIDKVTEGLSREEFDAAIINECKKQGLPKLQYPVADLIRAKGAFKAAHYVQEYLPKPPTTAEPLKNPRRKKRRKVEPTRVESSEEEPVAAPPPPKKRSGGYQIVFADSSE